MRSDHRHLTAYQVSCEVGQSIILILRPAILDRHILAFDVPAFANALPECGHKTCSVGGRRAAEEPDYRHRRLLRTRRQRPRYCRAAEKRDELAPPQVEHAASSPGATAIIRPPLAVFAQSVCRHLQLADGGLNRLWAIQTEPLFVENPHLGTQATPTLTVAPCCSGRKVVRFSSSKTKVPPGLIA